VPASIPKWKGLTGSLGDQRNGAGWGEQSLGDAGWREQLAARPPAQAERGWPASAAPSAALRQWAGPVGGRFGQLSHLGDDPQCAYRRTGQSRQPAGRGQSTLAVGRLAPGGKLTGLGLSRELRWLAPRRRNRRVATASLEDNRPGSPLAGVAAAWRNQPPPALVRLSPPRLADQRGRMAASLPGDSACQLSGTQGFATNANTSSTRMRRMMISSSIWL